MENPLRLHIDFTEECRDALPDSAGWTDYPFDGSETLDMMMEDWRQHLNPNLRGQREREGL